MDRRPNGTKYMAGFSGDQTDRSREKDLWTANMDQRGLRLADEDKKDSRPAYQWGRALARPNQLFASRFAAPRVRRDADKAAAREGQAAARAICSASAILRPSGERTRAVRVRVSLTTSP